MADRYFPASNLRREPKFDPDKDRTACEERMHAWLGKHRRRPCRIESVEADLTGGFSMGLTGGYRLDVVAFTSDREDEHWRLLGPWPGTDSPPHFVAEGRRAYRMT